MGICQRSSSHTIMNTVNSYNFVLKFKIYWGVFNKILHQSYKRENCILQYRRCETKVDFILSLNTRVPGEQLKSFFQSEDLQVCVQGVSTRPRLKDVLSWHCKCRLIQLLSKSMKGESTQFSILRKMCLGLLCAAITARLTLHYEFQQWRIERKSYSMYPFI